MPTENDLNQTDKAKQPFLTLTPFEKGLWISSLAILAVSYFASGSTALLPLVASLIGATNLILAAKGHILAPFFGIAFSLLYTVISYTYCYWGEMATYLFLNFPACIVTIVSWIRHPSDRGNQEVAVSDLSPAQIIGTLAVSIAATVAFYFILRYFDTPNLMVSTFSVTTSVLAALLLVLRSPFYALAYMANDVVLILLWTLACLTDISYVPMAVNFAVFLVNDAYGFKNWRSMKARQRA